MTHEFCYKCYFLPFVAGIGYLILELPTVKERLTLWVPDPKYLLVTKVIILICWVFIFSLILDNYNCLSCFG